MREEVERLEHDPDPSPHRVLVRPARRDVEPIDQDATRVDRLQEVDAPQKGGLPRPGRPDQADNLVRLNDEIDPLQNLEVVEGLLEPLDPDRLRHSVAPP